VGLVIGAAAGTIAGSLYDVAQIGVGGDFLAEVSKHLLPGKMAVVAEVDEGWVTPLDSRMEHLGGIVVRRARGEFIDAQIEREIEAEKAEIAKLKVGATKPSGKPKPSCRLKSLPLWTD